MSVKLKGHGHITRCWDGPTFFNAQAQDECQPSFACQSAHALHDEQESVEIYDKMEENCVLKRTFAFAIYANAIFPSFFERRDCLLS